LFEIVKALCGKIFGPERVGKEKFFILRKLFTACVV